MRFLHVFAAACGVLAYYAYDDAVRADGVSPLETAWRDRETPGGLDAAIAAYAAASQRQDATPLVFERLVHARYFRAWTRLEDGSDEQTKEFERAVADGVRGVAAASKLGGSAPAEAGDLDDSLGNLGATAIGPLYWMSACYGRTIEQMSVFRKPGAAKRFKRLMERCVEIDGSFFHGGPHRALAGYLSRAPGIMGGDEKLAKKHAEDAIRSDPNYAENYVVRAEYVWLPAKDRARYEADLKTAIALPDDACPDAIPEQRVVKAKAAKALAESGDKF